MPTLTRRISLVLLSTVSLAVGLLLPGSAHAVPDCDVPNPPPVCNGGSEPTPPTPPTPVAPRTSGDFDGDGRADITVYRRSDRTWYTVGSKTGAPLPAVAFPHGFTGDSDTVAPGHFNADARADQALFVRHTVDLPFDGAMAWRSSTTGAMNWGPTAERDASPVPGDYNGDGRDELAHWDWFTGTWHVPGFPDRQWGAIGDVPVPGDYDKDKRTDLAVWRRSTGTWHVIRSSDGAVVARQWGVSTDRAVPGDYDKDGKTDFAIWRPSTGVWHIINSSTNTSWWAGWGQPGDIPVPLDYNGDRKTDFAVWRYSNGTWYVWPNGSSSSWSRHWGQSGDSLVGAR